MLQRRTASIAGVGGGCPDRRGPLSRDGYGNSPRPTGRAAHPAGAGTPSPRSSELFG